MTWAYAIAWRHDQNQKPAAAPTGQLNPRQACPCGSERNKACHGNRGGAQDVSSAAPSRPWRRSASSSRCASSCVGDRATTAGGARPTGRSHWRPRCPGGRRDRCGPLYGAGGVQVLTRSRVPVPGPRPGGALGADRGARFGAAGGFGPGQKKADPARRISTDRRPARESPCTRLQLAGSRAASPDRRGGDRVEAGQRGGSRGPAGCHRGRRPTLQAGSTPGEPPPQVRLLPGVDPVGDFDACPDDRLLVGMIRLVGPLQRGRRLAGRDSPPGTTQLKSGYMVTLSGASVRSSSCKPDLLTLSRGRNHRQHRTGRRGQRPVHSPAEIPVPLP